MDKLITRLPIILIGLSIFLFSSCILTEIDPPEKYYIERYLNSSNKEVTIVMKNTTTSEIVEISTISQGQESSLHIDSDFNGGDTPIKGYVDDLLRGNINKIEIYVADVLVKEWGTPVGNFGSEINNPFNYDSWDFESIEPTGNNVVGKIIFTITNDDLE